MRSLSMLLVALCLAVPRAAADGYAEAMTALGAGRYDDAARSLAAEADPLLRQEGWARMHIAAGNPSAGLRAAATGLDRAPEHLGLLFQACRAALWLSAGEAAVGYAERLLAAVEASSSLAPEHRAQWRETAEDFHSQGREIVDRARRQRGAVTRARTTALAVLGACLCGLAAFAARR